MGKNRRAPVLIHNAAIPIEGAVDTRAFATKPINRTPCSADTGGSELGRKQRHRPPVGVRVLFCKHATESAGGGTDADHIQLPDDHLGRPVRGAQWHQHPSQSV